MMPLVDYASDSDSSFSSSPPSAPSKLPPLPAAFHDLYASTVRQSTTDDPSLHHGRRRHTPHVAGHWPSHIYLTWLPSPSQQNLLHTLVRAAAQRLGANGALHSFLKDELAVPLPLHVSLSRPLVLTTANKDAFLIRAQMAISSAGVGSFALSPRGLAWYYSPDADRTFLVVKVTRAESHGNEELAKLLANCNAATRAFGQPELYAVGADVDEAAFHVSIAWTLGNPTAETAGLDDAIDRLMLAERFGGIHEWKIPIESVKIKIGNVVTSIEL